jgi:hypothetical protein
LISGGTPIAPIAFRRLEKNFVRKERMFVAGKQIKNNKIKRALQMIYFFMMMIWWLCVFFFLSYKLFYFVSKERIFVVGRQIKRNKIKKGFADDLFFFYDGDMMIMCVF